MVNKDKIERLTELTKIPLFAREDHRNSLDKDGKLPFMKNLPRKERRRILAGSKKIADKYCRIITNLSSSGSGFHTDQVLRQMAVEYTHRYASSGIHNQPVSFNYFEPFCNIKLIEDSIAPYVELTEEINHLFNPLDFFDYLTSSDSDSFCLKSLHNIPEATSFHFAINGDVNDLNFLNAEGREFVISGFSMIRRGNSVHWYLIGGEVLDQEEWDFRCSKQLEIDINKLNPWKRAFLSEAIEKSGNKNGSPVPLSDSENSIKTIIAGEMDLKTSKHVARCYMAEYEHMFEMFSDDPEICYSGYSKEEWEVTQSNMIKHINKSSTMWSLAEGLLQLPHYFNCRIAIDKNILKNHGKRLHLSKGGKGIKSIFERVPAIEVTNDKPSLTIQEIKIPHYKVETDGHWRRLQRDEIGFDRDGNQIRGKTWITESNKWKDRTNYLDTIYIKDSLGAAKLKIAEYIRASEYVEKENNIDSKAKDIGWLYVMRCMAMQQEIYKVGYTNDDPKDRAKSLSAATGVPLSFVVVKSWPHQNPSLLEAEVHAMLDPYRINERREFFHVKFETIEKIVTNTLSRLSKT